MYLISITTSSQHPFINNKNCSYDYYTDSPEAYYINLQSSTKRNKHKEQLLSAMKLRDFRVEGICSDNTYIANDIADITSQKINTCKFQTNEPIESSIINMQKSGKTHVVTGLCSNELRPAELYCTMSHLYAIYRAVHSTTTTSKYALIMEDDVYIPVSTDYNALAASAPADFGVLQLLTSQIKWLKSMRDDYIKKPLKGIWSKHTNTMWSAGLYLINREKMQPIIDAIIHIDPLYPHIIQFKLIAALSYNIHNTINQCNTTYTPHTTTDSIQSTHTPPVSTSSAVPSYNTYIPCIKYNKIVADGFIYAMLPTYTIKLPIAYHLSDFKSTFQPKNIRSMAYQEALTISTLFNTTGGRTNYTIPTFPFRTACVGKGEILSVPKPERENRV